MKMQIRMRAMTMAGLVHVALALSLFTSVAAYGQSNDPCAGVAAANEQQRALERQIANEPNPLTREGLQARLNQARSASIDASNRAKTANQGRFAGLTGRVTAFDPVSYNGSHGFVLVVTLSCGYTVSVRFREITNPAWGGMDPNDDTPLAPWRRALETIVVGDTVTVSGRFGNHFALMTKLQKRGGAMYEVPDPGDLQERARAQEQQRNEAIAQRLANQLAGSWSGDWAMGGVLNPMATTSGNFVLQLAQGGSTLTGTYIEKGGQSSVTGSIRGRQLNIEYTYSDGSRRALSGNLDATGTVSGTWTQGPVTGTWKMAKSSAQSNTTQGGAVGQPWRPEQSNSSPQPASSRRDACVALLGDQFKRFESIHPQYASMFVFFGGTTEETSAMATQISQLLGVRINPGHSNPNYGRTEKENERYQAGCVGYREDINGTLEGAQCIVDLLGPGYAISIRSCRAAGFPYNVIPAAL